MTAAGLREPVSCGMGLFDKYLICIDLDLYNANAFIGIAAYHDYIYLRGICPLSSEYSIFKIRHP